MLDLTAIIDQQTNGINYDITTEDLIVKLREWDKQYGIEISEVSFDSLIVRFENLPGDLEALAREIYEFCPDVIDQGFGCFDDALPMMMASGQEVPPETEALLTGVDWNDPDFGLTILKNSLHQDRAVFLWWD
ncbi:MULTISPECIES: DUF4253 domain-containing protein [unclassified Synechocystis]|uniref:DUF4253 domain-containing protein n=1 Tax=unclassified Synechocystis TaxID=2640012 RepID=UPI00041DB28C|nr:MULTISPECIES: DUF4253 domain-containing protein [unclassified Synechocystis]AIE73383.1 putative Cytosolic Protein [Synechocystis sp. PCC 6714]MCT0254252.1 DUF4253 domain-containing protein [Synechocystis sp. CS-94]